VSLAATARSIPGTLRQEVVIDGRHRLFTDQPEHAGGEGTAPSPHELFPAALAACVTVTLVTYARTKEWDIGDVTVDVDYDHRSTPRIVEVSIELTGELSDLQLERLERVAAACPLRRSIETGIEFVERIERRPSRSPAARRRPCAVEITEKRRRGPDHEEDPRRNRRFARRSGGGRVRSRARQ
jgi:putative redox protein